MNDKQLLIDKVRAARKRNGKNHPKTYKTIYNLVREYPYYEGYEEHWLSTNGYNMNRK